MTRELDGMAGCSLINEKELAFLVENLPTDGLMLEIGTYHGVTAAEVAGARPKARLVCVDPFIADTPDTDGMIGNQSHWRLNARDNMRLFVGTAREFALQNDILFDVVFIDGNHTYEACLDDLRCCSPLVKPGGVLLAHDYGRVHGDRVEKAVNEFVDDSVWEIKGKAWTLIRLRRENVLRRCGQCA